MKKLQKDAAAKAQAAANDLANKGPKERSPHTKEVRIDIEGEYGEGVYHKACAGVVSNLRVSTPRERN